MELSTESDLRYYLPDTSNGRSRIMNDAKQKAQSLVQTDYPYAIYRERQDISRVADQTFQKYSTLPDFIKRLEKDGYLHEYLDRWKANVVEAKRLYTSTFIASYLETVAARDEAARPKVQPQPQPQPAATPSNTATLQGATFTIRKIDPSADEIVYYLEINHPGVTDGVEVLPLAYPISNSSPLPSASFSDVATSSGRVMASSDAVEARGSQFSVKKGSKFYIKK